jgi:hypothetical protein
MYIRRRIERVLFLILAVLVVASCNNNQKINGTNPTKNDINEISGIYDKIDATTVLTGVFEECEKYEIANKYYEGKVTFLDNVEPYYNIESNTLTFIVEAIGNNNIKTDDGLTDFISNENLKNAFQINYHLLEMSNDGKIVNDILLDVPENSWLYDGKITDQDFYISYITYNDAEPQNHIIEVRYLNGNVESKLCVEDVFPGTVNGKLRISYSANKLIIACEKNIIVLDNQLNITERFFSPNTIVDVGFMNGNQPSCICVEGQPDMEAKYSLYLCDSKTNSLHEEYVIPDGSDLIGYSYGNFYVYFHNNIYVGVFDDKTNSELMNYRNSLIPGNMSLLYFFDENYALYRNSNNESNFHLFRHTEDIDISERSTITIATTQTPDRNTERIIREWNRLHPELYIILNDLSDENDYTIGTDKLSFNLANNLYTPDIVLTTYNNTVIDTILKKDLYADLRQFMDSDDMASYENVFPAVVSAFTDYENGLWGITPEFSVYTVFCLSDTLEKYNGNNMWTVNDYISCVQSLPAAIAPGRLLTQENYQDYLGPSGFNNWIDYERGTCHFDNADFYEYLHFIKSLPAETNEYMAKFHLNTEEFYRQIVYNEALAKGTIAFSYQMCGGVCGLIETEFKFGTWNSDRLSMAGFPSLEGKRTNALFSDKVFIITSFCNSKENAWEIIKLFFESNQNTEEFLLKYRFPTLKSSFRLIENYFNDVSVYVDSSNNQIKFLKNDEINGTEKVDKIPSSYLSDVFDMLCDMPIVPYTAKTPEPVISIINEEISAYIGNVGDEKSTARKIQSRISIWLSEHN